MLPDRGAGGTELPRRPAPGPGAAAAPDRPLRAPREAPLTGVPPPSSPAPCRSQPHAPPQSHTPRTEPRHGAACLPTACLPCPVPPAAPLLAVNILLARPLYIGRTGRPSPSPGPAHPAPHSRDPPPLSRSAPPPGEVPDGNGDGTAGALRCWGRASRRLPAAPARPRTTSPGVRRAPPERHLGRYAAARVRGTRTGAEGSCSELETQGSWKPTGTTGSPQDARCPCAWGSSAELRETAEENPHDFLVCQPSTEVTDISPATD